MAYASLDDLIAKNRIFYHFAQLSKIPRNSFEEKAASDFVADWAKSLGLEVRQDAWNNVLIRKPATAGFEDKPAVMIQAHLDMVCQKAPGVEHDFSKDPIHLQLDGDLLSTGGRTTLGGDDGIGVALGMALLEAQDIRHPELELLCTTNEEDDMSGALNVDASDFHAKYLINLDNAVESQGVSGSCGGCGCEVDLPVSFQTASPDGSFMRISVTGLQGGHSGEDIHRGRGNANIFLTRLLLAARRVMPLNMVSLSGGTVRNALPRDAAAEVMIESGREREFLDSVNVVAEQLRREYKAVAHQLRITLERCGAPGDARVVSAESTDRFIRFLVLCPNGIAEMNGGAAGIVQSSDNLGVISLDKDQSRFKAIFEVRAAFKSKADYICEKIKMLCEFTGALYRKFAVYPGWPNDPDSKLVPLVQKAYRETLGADLPVLPIHCGLECGCLIEKRPEFDAISIGPDCWDLHSPLERLSVSSTERIYAVLARLLAEIE